MSSETSIKNRIVGTGEERLDQIQFNPRNWRIHPAGQQDGLVGILEEIGWIQNVIINKRTGHLIDGHLRCQLAARRGERTIPVLYVDLDEREEELALATFDPISAMAVADREKLKDILDSVQTENEQLMEMFESMRTNVEFCADVLDGNDDIGEYEGVIIIFNKNDAQKVRARIQEEGMYEFASRIVKMI